MKFNNITYLNTSKFLFKKHYFTKKNINSFSISKIVITCTEQNFNKNLFAFFEGYGNNFCLKHDWHTKARLSQKQNEFINVCTI